MSTWVPARNIDQLVEELPGVRAELLQRAATVARGTAQLSKDHKVRPVVAVVDGTVRVTTRYSFAHLDEYGSIHNPPTAALRRSASRNGRWVPDARAGRTPAAKRLRL